MNPGQIKNIRAGESSQTGVAALRRKRGQSLMEQSKMRGAIFPHSAWRKLAWASRRNNFMQVIAGLPSDQRVIEKDSNGWGTVHGVPTSFGFLPFGSGPARLKSELHAPSRYGPIDTGHSTPATLLIA